MRTLGLGQGLKPVRNLVETFLARGFCHARIHVCVFVRFARNRGCQICIGRADRQSGRGIAGFFKILKMAMRVAGFAFRRGTKYRRNVVVTFNVSFGRKVQVATIRWRFAGECVLEILFDFAFFQLHVQCSQVIMILMMMILRELRV